MVSQNKKDFLIFFISFLIFFLISYTFIFYFFQDKNDDYEETISTYKENIVTNEESETHNTAKEFWDDFSNIEAKTEYDVDVSKRYREIISSYQNDIKEKEIEIEKPDLKLNFVYNPNSLESFLYESGKKDNINNFLLSKNISSDNLDLQVNFNENTDWIRWKFKDWVIYLFWVLKEENDKLLAVFIHEFWHYIDIVHFDNFWYDESDNFYNISWDSTRVLKWWQKVSDFVSWYAMTNKYEDFAESFIYYVIHNKSFAKKAEKSEFLKKKYDFFSQRLFTDWSFKETDFWKSEEILDYYRDITKIDYFLENFLNYLKSWI